MVVSLWDIANALIGTAVLATQTTITPIPQSFDYSALASYQIYNGHFSSDAAQTPRVAAAETQRATGPGPLPTQPPSPAPTPPPIGGKPQLDAFIINNSPCGNLGIPITYRLYIRNNGDGAATEITVQNQYPDRTTLLSVSRSPDAIDPAARLLTWRESGLTAGNFLQYTLTVSSAPGILTDLLTVDYFDDNPVVARRQHFRTQTSHTLDDKSCQDGLSPTSPLPTNKFPAIICDPAEIGCQKFLPSLGIRFQNAKSFVDNPVLGKRFQEAVADILPGECSVVADDIISAPQYQDALNRKGKPADAYIEPLYQSGQDFKRLVHEDMLLGWKHIKDTHQQLQKLHDKKWQEHNDIVQKVLDDNLSGSKARDQVQQLLTEWQQQLISIQQDISRQYIQIQDERTKKFQPVADKAIQNARDSIQRACGTSSDGGLSATLPDVQKTYEVTISGRTTSFATTQQRFASLNLVAAFWQQNLYPALTQFDQGNTTALKTYRGSVSGAGRNQTFNALFEAYYQHLRDDEDAFNRVRLDHFEKALDAPKQEATTCEKKKVFGPPVGTSWCESGTYPAVLFKPTPPPLRSALPPDTSSLDGTKAKIDVRQVRGQVCGGKPGDPWWAAGCACQCNEAVATDKFDANGVPLVFICQSGQPIVLHDIRVTSKEECLAELKHDHGSDLERF